MNQETAENVIERIIEEHFQKWYTDEAFPSAQIAKAIVGSPFFSESFSHDACERLRSEIAAVDKVLAELTPEQQQWFYDAVCIARERTREGKS